MISLFRTITNRVKALFATAVAMEFEAELMAHHAEQQADLYRRANRYEEEGLSQIAKKLRTQAESLSQERPLASVLPALEHWSQEQKSADELPKPIAAPNRKGGKALSR